jgi:hypothetical protein
MAYNLRTGLTGSGDIDIKVNLQNLSADNIVSGVFGDARIPNLNASKITASLHAHFLFHTIISHHTR